MNFVDLDEVANGDRLRVYLKEITGKQKTPYCFISGFEIEGSMEGYLAAVKDGRIDNYLRASV